MKDYPPERMAYDIFCNALTLAERGNDVQVVFICENIDDGAVLRVDVEGLISSMGFDGIGWAPYTHKGYSKLERLMLAMESAVNQSNTGEYSYD